MRLAHWILALAVPVMLVGCVNRAQQAQSKRTEKLAKDPTVLVTLATTTSGSVEDRLSVTGSIQAQQESTVGATAAGRLVAVYVRDGQAVGAGSAIAQVDNTDAAARLRQALAQESQARAALNQAMTDSKAGPNRSTAALQAAQARLAQANARLALAKKGARQEERTQAEWGVKRTKSDLDVAKSDLDRTRKLVNEGVLAGVEMERAQNSFDNAQAAYNAALQTLSQVENAVRPEELESAKEEVKAAEANVRLERANKSADATLTDQVNQARASLRSASEAVVLARKGVADTTVRSPFGGKVSGRPLQVGTVVSPGTVVCTVVGTGDMYFEAKVPSTGIDRVSVGAAVDIVLGKDGGAKYHGQVVSIDPAASGVGRVFTLRVSLGEGSGLLKSGMFAKGSILLSEREGVTLVPSQALVRDGEQAYVIVAEGGKAKRVTVQAGLVKGKFTEVKGISSGIEVVTAGQQFLVDGTPIRVETAEEKAASTTGKSSDSQGGK
ncbi:MAG: efflux RND transporter periplasmic adaptor subunit [Fimbriimonadaceae bacterium]|nr:efflux RND transporter periplasmic adaptor subunit [Fimbriimonadaceae bacterium]